MPRCLGLPSLGVLLLLVTHAACTAMGPERVVFQTTFGDIEFGMLPEFAPVTANHIFKLAAMGCYTGNHFFRVDKGFVLQTADIVGGRLYPMNPQQQAEAEKNVPLEVTPAVKHTYGMLSMGRLEAPDSGHSSFSIMLGTYTHLDMKHTIFAQVTSGEEAMRKMQQVETRKEGFFILPKERVTIFSSYVYLIIRPVQLPLCHECGYGYSTEAMSAVRKKVEETSAELALCKMDYEMLKVKCTKT